MNIIELEDFNKICDDLSNGKYILADTKITALLKLIYADEKIKDIVDTCLEKCNFLSVYKDQLNPDNTYTLIVPTDDKEIVSLVYNLLYRFSSNQMNLNEFLNKYFGESNSYLFEFNQFGKTLILPFKNAVNNIYANRHIIADSADYQANYYNKIITDIKLILNNIDNYKLQDNDKDEFIMLLNSLYLASEKSDKKLVYSLMIGIDYFTRVHKKARIAYLTLEECFGT